MNYGEIRTQFRSILNRSDCTNGLADTFLNQAMLRAAREARVQQQQAVSSGTPSSGVYAVPSDLKQVILITVDGKPLQSRTLLQFTSLEAQAGQPIYWCRVNDEYQFWPTPADTAAVEVFYYGDYEAFTGDNDETELSAIAWDLIVYGGLSYAADHFIDERAERFEGRYQQILQSVQDTSQTEDGETEMQPAYRLDGET